MSSTASRYVTFFWELEVYLLCSQVSFEIFDFSKSFPNEEKYSLTNQIRRSSRAIGAQIAEAWGKRRYERHFISKLTDADGEQEETVHWLMVAEKCGYLSGETALRLRDDCAAIHRMLQSMQDKSHLFCRGFGPKPEDTSDNDGSPSQ